VDKIRNLGGGGGLGGVVVVLLVVVCGGVRGGGVCWGGGGVFYCGFCAEVGKVNNIGETCSGEGKKQTLNKMFS